MTKIPTPPAKWTEFAIPGVDVMLMRRSGSHPMVPAVDPAYVFRDALVRELAYLAFPPVGARPLPGLFMGPKGCGKTTLILQVAAHCNIPCYRINLNVGTTVRHLKGHRGAQPGRTVHYEGIAVRAMEEGAWLILDEISGATPPVALSLFPILEHDGAVLLEDAEPPRYVTRHGDFRVFATDNTIGASAEDTRFNYGGTNPDVNEALLDRFGGFIEVNYLPPALEHEAVKGVVPEIEDIVLEGIVRVMNHLRSATIDYGFSTRMTINWAQRMALGHRRGDGSNGPLYINDAGDVDFGLALPAARVAFLNGMRSRIDRDAAEEVITRIYPERVGAP